MAELTLVSSFRYIHLVCTNWAMYPCRDHNLHPAQHFQGVENIDRRRFFLILHLPRWPCMRFDDAFPRKRGEV